MFSRKLIKEGYFTRPIKISRDEDSLQGGLVGREMELVNEAKPGDYS